MRSLNSSRSGGSGAVGALAVWLLLSLCGYAQNTRANPYKRLSLEDLAGVDVSSVSRTNQQLNRVPAAVTVISSDDIRRLGVTNLKEALRYAPGMDVARASADGWAISSRGFNGSAANKLLVLIDGRTIYSPVFAGVFWETQDLLMDDIERIEIVRGPGASLYGANAINGIINIITKSAHQTRDSLIVVGGGGATDLAAASFRVGGGRGPDFSYRVYSKYLYIDQSQLPDGSGAQDGAKTGHTGFRADLARPQGDFTLQADIYDADVGIRGRNDSNARGGNILGRWAGKTASSEYHLQMYYERDYRRVPEQSEFAQHVFDVDFQDRFSLGAHALAWGAEYRYNRDESFPTAVLRFNPADRTYPLATAFVQHEVSLAKDAVRLTTGSKFEHNDFTGFEFQPSFRASWSPGTRQTVWSSISRTVRTPTRFDSDVLFTPPGLAIQGNPAFQAEELVAFEVGYRAVVLPTLSVDVATFINDYDSLRSLEIVGPGRAGVFNDLNARTHGVEIASNFDAFAWLRFRGAYSFLGKRLTMEPGKVDIFGGSIEGNDPRHQFYVAASANLSANVEWDSSLRFVSQLPVPVVPRYTEMDTRIAWHSGSDFEVALIGRNLLRPRHPEFNAATPTQSQVERNIYLRITTRF